MWIFLLFFFKYFNLFFVNFGGLSLPCHLLCCLLLFVYFCFVFFPSWIFWVFLFAFFCKFNYSWHFFTSSGHVPLGVGCTAPPFRGRVSKGSKLYN